MAPVSDSHSMSHTTEYYLNDFIAHGAAHISLPHLLQLDMNVMFYDPTGILGECALARLIRTTVCRDQVLSESAFQIAENAPARHTVRYVRTRVSNNNFDAVLKYMHHISLTRHVFMMRHIFVLDGLDALSITHQHALLPILDKATVTVLSTVRYTTVSPVLKARFNTIRIPPLPDRKIQEVFLKYVKHQNMDPESYAGLPKKLGYDLRKCLVAMTLPPSAAELVKSSDVLEKTIKAFFTSVARSTSLPTIVQSTRDCFNLLMKYSSDHSVICRCVWDVLAKRHAKSTELLTTILSMVARLNVDVLRASKPICHYERFVIAYCVAVDSD